MGSILLSQQRQQGEAAVVSACFMKSSKPVKKSSLFPKFIVKALRSEHIGKDEMVFKFDLMKFG